MPRKVVNQGGGRLRDDADSSGVLSKEQILNQLHQLYVHPANGLLSIGKKLGLHLFAPRRKVNILLVGNHSSGKSSFINWYTNCKVQKTGVAIETQGFTLVTCAKARETLTGKATLRLYPYMKPLELIKGVLQYLSTELTPSSSRRFNLVTFIDTPGLADGELHYPYDIERAILCLGDTADLIFVFFDPIGQALCKRTLNLVERLTNLYSERMRYFLSKADEAGEEADRQKVMMQIVQELCKRQGLNQCGFEMSTIFIPDHDSLKIRQQMCTNQIEDVCGEIEKTIALTIQNTFNTLETDIDQLEELASSKLVSNQSSMRHNIKNGLKLLLILFLCLQFPLSVFLAGSSSDSLSFSFPISAISDAPFVEPTRTDWYVHYPQVALGLLYQASMLYMYGIHRVLLFFLPAQYLFLSSILLALPILFVSRFFICFQKTLGLSDMSEMKRILRKLDIHRRSREELYSNYLNQMLHDVDISTSA